MRGAIRRMAQGGLAAALFAAAAAESLAQAPPPPWEVTLIQPQNPPFGAVGFAGGSFTVTAAGPMGGATDRFTYVSQVFLGENMELTARVTLLLSNPGGASSINTQAGLMIRDSLTTNGRFAMITAALGTPASTQVPSVRFTRRVAVNGATTVTSLQGFPVPGGTTPLWLRLRRNNNTYSQFWSFDGITWNLLMTPTPPSTPAIPLLGSTVRVGLMVASHAAAVQATAVFDNVTIAPLPP